MNLKQLFCIHVWKEEKEEFLRRMVVPVNEGCYISYSHYNVYAVHQTCLKCNKSRIAEVKKMII